jgi:hypothetical protein
MPACILPIGTDNNSAGEKNIVIKTFGAGAAAVALAALSLVESAGAVPVLCEDPAVNHMYIDSATVSSCLAGGSGNINGNAKTDDFLTGEGAGLGLVGIGSASHTQSGSDGTFSLSPGFWEAWNEIAIGFKFGTGNQPDEWFVYMLNPLVSSGDWDFVNMFGKGGGLSHVQLYGKGKRTQVPEPGTLALLGLGLIGVSCMRRRKRA